MFACKRVLHATDRNTPRLHRKVTRKHDVNRIAAAPKDVPEVGDYLDSNPEVAQSVADAGRRMIWEKHSVHARGRQLKRLLHAIVQGRFKRAVWDKGEFVISAPYGHAIPESIV